ncbi:MAG: hypothetical protein HY336_01285 [Candidatus Doudnabacteria bacterium]|nr:hypothetical protein [Candidatus Doudnabacteria bacterium]
MSSRNFEIETGPIEPTLRRIASEKNSEALRPPGESEALTSKYNAIMANYVEALDSNPELAEDLLRQANRIIEQLNMLASASDDEKLQEMADELTARHLLKRKIN